MKMLGFVYLCITLDSVFMIRVCIRLNNIGGALEFDLVAAAKIRSATAEFGLSSIA